jgi:hypothetical protein
MHGQLEAGSGPQIFSQHLANGAIGGEDARMPVDREAAGLDFELAWLGKECDFGHSWIVLPLLKCQISSREMTALS